MSESKLTAEISYQLDHVLPGYRQITVLVGQDWEADKKRLLRGVADVIGVDPADVDEVIHVAMGDLAGRVHVLTWTLAAATAEVYAEALVPRHEGDTT